MTLEPSLPYVSIACAIGACVVTALGSASGVQRMLRSGALFALAIFAFLRGIGPAAIALALVLSALGWAMTQREASRRNLAAAGLFTLAGLTLAYLCLRAGGGLDVLITPARLVLALPAVVVIGGLLAWSRRAVVRGPLVWEAEALALGLLLLASLTLRQDQWPAMAAALGLLTAHGAKLALQQGAQPQTPAAGETLIWLLSYLGQATMAYIFLR